MILEKTNIETVPLSWVNLNSLRDSAAFRREIYLHSPNSEAVTDLALLFYDLFGEIKDQLLVWNRYWWDFCLSTWDPNTENSDYSLGQKPKETRAYIDMLTESGIDYDFSNCCKCLNWDNFLGIILKCIMTNQAIYSPLIFDEENDFFFYFHSTGSIGLYYKSENTFIARLLEHANHSYRVMI